MNLQCSTFLALLLSTPSVAAFSTRPVGWRNVVRETTTNLGMQSTLDGESSRDTTSLQAVSVVSLDDAVEKKSWDDDGFIFGLEGSGLERPKGKTAVTVVEGDNLETQPYQVAFVQATFAAHAFFASSSLHGMLAEHNGDIASTALQAVLLTVVSWVTADFGSGVLHWSVDNYGNGRTPVMGGIIAAFQGHHSAPWTITERGFCNNVYKLCIPFGIAPMALISSIASPSVTFFFTVFCALEIMSQEIHKWSHQTKSEVPEYVNWFQEMGLTVHRKAHAQHHMAPFEGNYSIVSGLCNPVLDGFGVFRRLEHFIYNINGVESNAWKLDPELRAKTLAGDYSPPSKSRKAQ